MRVRIPSTALGLESANENIGGFVTEKKPTPKPRGPDPDTLKIEGDWEEAVKKAIRKKRPPATRSPAPRRKKQ